MHETRNLFNSPGKGPPSAPDPPSEAVAPTVSRLGIAPNSKRRRIEAPAVSRGTWTEIVTEAVSLQIHERRVCDGLPLIHLLSSQRRG